MTSYKTLSTILVDPLGVCAIVERRTPAGAPSCFFPNGRPASIGYVAVIGEAMSRAYHGPLGAAEAVAHAANNARHMALALAHGEYNG